MARRSILSQLFRQPAGYVVCSQFSRQKQQASVAQGIRTMTVKRGAWVLAREEAKRDV